MNKHTDPATPSEAFTLKARFEIQEITDQVIWGDTGVGRPMGVLAKIVDHQTGQALQMFVSEQQLLIGRSHNTGDKLRQVEDALAAITAAASTHGVGKIDGPLSVLANGPRH